MSQTELDAAYQACLRIATQHYENFPVASRLLPNNIRRAIAVIYAFARTADDIADEGNADTSTRLEQLAHFSKQLDNIAQQQEVDEPLFIALADVVRRFKLPIHLLHDLLSAFQQDVQQHGLMTAAEIQDYCRRSAHPIGRLLLHLSGQTATLSLLQSDSICTALQLINFYQDIEQDYVDNQRVYLDKEILTQSAIHHFAITAENSRKIAPKLREKFRYVAQLIEQGLPLGQVLSGRMAWQIRFTILSALSMLLLLSMQNDQHLFSRPRFKKWQRVKPAVAALSYDSYASYARYLIIRINLINQEKR